jgi:hypothetical protein
MANLSKTLASPWLAFLLLGGMAAWLGLGAVLAQVETTASLMRTLNQGRGLAWLASPAFVNPPLGGWLAGLGLLGGLLLLNLVFCSLVWFSGKGIPANRRRALLLAVHWLLALVITGHGASFALGYKQNGVRLASGEEIVLPDGYRVRLGQVNFGADPALLALPPRQARQAMSRASFVRKENWAWVELTAPDGKLADGRVGYFQPLRLGAVSVHLASFFRPSDQGRQDQVGAVFNVTRCPLAVPFFAAYFSLLLCMGCLLWLGRKRPGGEPSTHGA